MYRWMFAFLGLALLLSGSTGCASGPTYSESVKTFSEVPADQGRIYLYRMANPVGSFVQPEIKLNGEKIGYSNPGGFFYIDRPAGEYTFTIGTETERKLVIPLKAGETKYIETSIEMGFFVGKPRLMEMSETNGKSAIVECRYTAQGK